MNAIVKLQVNEGRLINNLKDAFSRKTTFIAELIQNARRAGATAVALTYGVDASGMGHLTVRDNGIGIQDMQHLLTVAESGWDESIQAAEQPFGMGFLSALFAAEAIEIISNGKRLAFRRDEVLAMADHRVEDGVCIGGGSLICLKGLSLTEGQILVAVSSVANGYPIQITVNGIEQERTAWALAYDHGETHPDWVEAVVDLPEIGRLVISNERNPINFFLSGVPIGACDSARDHGRSHYGSRSSIAHLDPRLFRARMPDRDTLVDPEAVTQTVFQGLRNWWRQRLEELLASSPSPAEVVSAYWDVAARWQVLDVFNDVPYLPVTRLWVMGTPRLQCDSWPAQDGERYSPEGKALVTRDEVESGQTVLCRNVPDDLDDREGKGFIPAMIAHLLGWLSVDVPAGHWAHRLAIPLDGAIESAQVIPEGHLVEGEDYFSDSDVVVRLCDRYRLRWNGHEVVGNQVPLALKEADKGVPEYEWQVALYVPRSFISLGAGLHQIGDYRVEESYDDSWFEEDVSRLRQLVDALMERPVVELVQRVITESPVGLVGYAGARHQAVGVVIGTSTVHYVDLGELMRIAQQPDITPAGLQAALEPLRAVQAQLLQEAVDQAFWLAGCTGETDFWARHGRESISQEERERWIQRAKATLISQSSLGDDAKALEAGARAVLSALLTE